MGGGQVKNPFDPDEIAKALGADGHYECCGKLLGDGEGRTCARKDGHNGECSPLPDKRGMSRVEKQPN